MTVSVLTIRQVPASDPPQFEVIRASDGKAAACQPVPSPVGFPVEGRPNSDLRYELAWYLERFLDFPFDPETDHARRVQDALTAWGQAAFKALYSEPNAIAWFADAIRDGLDKLELRIASDDPRVLAWPWEALNDPQTGTLAHTCRIERRLDTPADPPPLPDSLPKDRINVLLVTCRPGGENDVGYRSISRRLVELVEERRLPVHVTLLRPPTFEQLRRHLRERPGYYHILHFDGHGVYGRTPAFNSHSRGANAPCGHLVFETADGTTDLKTADDLAVLLREFRVPAVVLNACQSAMIDDRTEDPFASVATSLAKAGVRRVVAMSYSLYVSAAQEFLPELYDRLFATGDFGEAVRAGRQQLLIRPGRVGARGRYNLADWIVPVLYSQGSENLSFAAAGSQADKTQLPRELLEHDNPYGFVGRDGALLQLERAMHRAPAVLLVTGLGGIGKTTLAHGFVEWLLRTDGLDPDALFWFRFDEIQSADYVLNRIGERFVGPQFATVADDQKLDSLLKLLCQHPCLMVWDNFESVYGIAGTSVSPKLPAEDRELLDRFARELRGARTKILLTSRSDESWLAKPYRFELRLGGLLGEECWELCETIIRDLNLKVNHYDPAMKELMDLLEGHPLAMRVVLPELHRSAADVLTALQQNVGLFVNLDHDAAERKMCATLRFATDLLPDDVQSLLGPLALHERFVDGSYLEQIARQVDEHWTRTKVDSFLNALSGAGLVQKRGHAIFELHPFLTRYLRSSVSCPDEWVWAFVKMYGGLANHITSKELHEQRFHFHVNSENFYTARREAIRLGLDTDYAALTQCLAFHAQSTRYFATAERLSRELMEWWQARADEAGVASAMHQLGIVAHKRRAFDDAERWYHKSLDISKRLGDEARAAKTYDNLGSIAHQRRAFDDAESWYHKSLDLSERLGDEAGAARTYHKLGNIAHERRAFDDAESWYHKSLDIKERLGNELGAAITYHELGLVAQQRRAFDDAEGWYRKSLDISERLGDESGAAMTYAHLGVIARERQAFDDAKGWYHKSLDIDERLGNAYGAAKTYHLLGIIAQEQRAFGDAERWYHKSLEIWERLGDEHSAAITYGQLGILGALRNDYGAATYSFVRCVLAFARMNDPHNLQQNISNFAIAYRKAPIQERGQMRKIWEEGKLAWSEEWSRFAMG